MARIKQVLSERRHAAISAAEILRERGDFDGAKRMEEDHEDLGEKLSDA